MSRNKRVPIVYEDQYLIVCEKPAGMPVQPDQTRDMDVQTILKHHIYNQNEDHGGLDAEPYLEAVHRLDRPVGGLMVYARTKEAAAALGKQIENNEFEKYYQAVVSGSPPEDSGSFEDYLVRDGRTNTSKLAAPGIKGARFAVLDYELIDQIETEEGMLSWLLIILHTGRHHQIRVQLASHKMPIYGDTKYHPGFQHTKKKYVQLGLYSTRLSFIHPLTGERMTFKTEPRGQAFEMMDVEAY